MPVPVPVKIRILTKTALHAVFAVKCQTKQSASRSCKFKIAFITCAVPLKILTVSIENARLTEIIDKAKSGNQMAFSNLLDHFWSEVYHFQLKRTQNENDAEDITIQTFARAFEKINSYDSNFAFSTWLFSISKNIHIDLIRKRKRNFLEHSENQGSDAMKLVLDETPSVEDQLIIEQNLKTLLLFLKKLKPAYREIIDLRYFQEMSYSEIAAKLGEPINTVKVKLLRAKKLLAELIAETSQIN